MNIFQLDQEALAPDSQENSSYEYLNLPGMTGGEHLGTTQELVFRTLRGILDPELGINVVDLGLVYELRVTEKDIYVKMSMTTPGCPMHGSIIEAVERALELYFPLYKTIVDLVWEPQWTPDRLSPEAKDMLGLD